MKNLYKNLFLGFCLSLVSISAFAGSDSISIGMTISQVDEEEHPLKGWRIPSSPEECTIDFENHCIVLSSSEFIITYELWDEEGTYIIGSNASDSEFVDFMSGLSGVYQLRLIGVEHVYVGYLEL